MIGLMQRVTEASVEVDGERIAAIGAGLMVLIGVERGDGEKQMERLLERLLNYRVFPDAEGLMNLSLRDTGGELLLVPQFTLPADTRKGNRPGFSTAAQPELGKAVFEAMVARACEIHPRVAAGRFGANMRVALVNDGPVTFWLQVP